MTYYFLTVEFGRQLFECLPAVETIDETLQQAKEIHADYPNANITLYSDTRSTITTPRKVGTYWDRHVPNYPADRVFLTRCKKYDEMDAYFSAKEIPIAVLGCVVVCPIPWYMVEDRISLTERKKKRYDVSKR